MKSVEKLKTYYVGEEAKKYDQIRKSQQAWKKEEEILNDLLKKISKFEGIKGILDIPVGTGRFLQLYENFAEFVIGIDASNDMLYEARKKSNSLTIETFFYQGDITNIKVNKKIDIAICIRLLNFFNETLIREVLRELSQVTNNFLIIGIKTKKNNFNYYFNNTINGVKKIPIFIKKVFEMLLFDHRKFIKKTKGRLKRNFRSSTHKIFIPKENFLMSCFKDFSFEILEKRLVQSSKKGENYYLFLLKK